MEIYGVSGMVGVHWTVWNAWFMSSCCSGCGLGLPLFPVSPIYILCLISLIMSSYPFEMIGSWPHVATVVVLVYFISHLSDICSYYFPHNVLIFQFLRRRVVYCIYDCCKDSRSIFFPVENGGSSWNFWELAIGERGQLELKDEKENMPLVGMVAIVTEVYGTVCQLYLINAFEHDSGDIKALWSQSIYHVYRYSRVCTWY